jgi:hypothetical protein
MSFSKVYSSKVFVLFYFQFVFENILCKIDKKNK